MREEWPRHVIREMSAWGQTWTLAGFASSQGSSHFRPRSVRSLTSSRAIARSVGHEGATPLGPELGIGLVVLCAVLGRSCQHGICLSLVSGQHTGERAVWPVATRGCHVVLPVRFGVCADMTRIGR